MGIPENILARVFSPLTTTKAKGMGMGLAICKRIKDVHGGKIAIESVVGEGTRVILRLPIKPQLEFVVEENGVSAFMDEKLEYMHP
jgi:signal transduction histidine kinase